MPRIQVFACPSCGASLSVNEGEKQVKCQFCGNTVIVPRELRPDPVTPSTTSYRERAQPRRGGGAAVILGLLFAVAGDQAFKFILTGP